MAILEDIPGIRASVYSNGYLDEFPDDHVAEWDLKGYTLPPRGRRASAYVRVVDDTEFSIKLDVTAPFRPINDLSFIAEVDGTLVCMTRAKHEDMQRMNWGGQIDAYYRRIDASQIISRPLKFCTLTKVDSADAAQVRMDAKHVAKVGEIIVSVYNTRLGHIEEASYATNNPREVREVSEKALKGQAISHSVGYGNEQRISRPMSQTTIFLDGRENPLAVFRFKYRSKKALQSELIIPRSPSPDFPRLNNAHGNVSREVKLSNLKNEIAKIKSEKDADIPAGRKRSRSDVPESGRAYKTSRTHDGLDYIDLTDD